MHVYEHEIFYLQSIVENFNPVTFVISDESVLSKKQFILEMKKVFGIVPFALLPGLVPENCIAIGYKGFESLDLFKESVKNRINTISHHYNVSIGYSITTDYSLNVAGSSPLGPTQN